jgi:hypothetical protein
MRPHTRSTSADWWLSPGRIQPGTRHPAVLGRSRSRRPRSCCSDAVLTSSQEYGWEWLGFRFVTIDRYRLYGAAGEAVEAVHALCSAYEGMEALARGTTRR